MKKKVAILTGHYGAGTGCSWQDRDEWTLALEYATALYETLCFENIVIPHVFSIDKDEFHWRVVGRCLTKLSSIEFKANWVKMVEADICIECHYNSFYNQTVKGHEIVAPSETNFAKIVNRYLGTLPNPRRQIRKRPNLNLFKYLKIPTLIIEPAFIWEDVIAGADWVPMLCAALKYGLYEFLEVDDERKEG